MAPRSLQALRLHPTKAAEKGLWSKGEGMVLDQGKFKRGPALSGPLWSRV